MGDQPPVLIVGSGIGGLTAAARLAHAGVPVTVFEQAKQSGGYLNPFKRKGFDLPPGLHLVSENEDGPFGRSLTSIDVNVDFIHLPPAEFETHHFPDFTTPFPRDRRIYFDALTERFPESAAELERFARLLKRMGEDLDWFNDRPLTSMGDLIRAALGLALRFSPNVRYRNHTWQQFLDKHISDPKLVAVLSAWCNAVGLPPTEASCLAGAGYFQTFAHHGGNYVRHGARGLRDAFTDSIERHGGQVLCRKRVTKILTEGRKATGVELEDGERFSSDLVISNADPKQTYGALLADYPHPKRIQRMLENYQPARGYFFLCLGLDPSGAEDNPLFAVSTRRFFSEFDVNAHFDAEKVSAGTGPLFFVTCPTARDPSKAPEGKHLLELVSTMPADLVEKWVDLPVMKRGEEYEELKKKYADRLIDRLAEFLPDIRERIIVMEAATPATHYNYTLNTGGTGAGMALTPKQMGPNRGVIVTHIDGLFVCGSGTPLGPSLVRCSKSGWMAAAKVLDARAPGLHTTRLPGTWI